MNQYSEVSIPVSSITNKTAEGIKPSVPVDITKQILEAKRPPLAEIELTLFENCNIECDFCHHDKKSMIGLTLNEMNSKLPIIEQFMKDKQDRVEMLQVNIVGGELFQDRWMEHLCADYYEIAKDISKLADKYNHNLRIVWVSNFLFTKKEVVHELVSKLRERNIDNHLIVSYDFDGRPMSRRYRDNIKWFGPDFIISANLVGTVESINMFMEDTDEYFKYLYNTFHIYFDEYIPDKGHCDMIPSDSLMLEWYKFIAMNYPKISPMRGLIENKSNPMHCMSLNKITIFPDNSVTNCRWDRYDQSDFHTDIDIKENAGIMQRFIDENSCLSCEYYVKCGFRCFTQWDWKSRERDLQSCPMKQFYKFLDEKLA